MKNTEKKNITKHTKHKKHTTKKQQTDNYKEKEEVDTG